MMNNLPEDIDDMPGGFPYDFTMPTALEKSELLNFHLVRTLMIMFPMWAWNEWLDYHANAASLKRREAGYASGEVTVVGDIGTQIPAGTIFAAPATDIGPAIEFHTTESYVIEKEEIVVHVIANEPGKGSNVSSGTISILSKPIKGIKSITNLEAITGGTEREDDDTLRERIQEVNSAEYASYVGNDSDYIRWAKEVIGVGSAIVIPEWSGPGTVKLVILDSNGQPANRDMIEKVYNHIMSPADRLLRLAPIGATLTVVAPSSVKINLSATIITASGYNKDYIIEEFKKNLISYYEQAKSEGVLKYTKIASVLSDTQGVSDYSNLLINEGTKNITIAQDEYPETGILSLVEE